MKFGPLCVVDMAIHLRDEQVMKQNSFYGNIKHCWAVFVRKVETIYSVNSPLMMVVCTLNRTLSLIRVILYLPLKSGPYLLHRYPRAQSHTGQVN